MVQSSLYFLQRDPIYRAEKVYELRRSHDPKIPRTNMRLDKIEGIDIDDVRGQNCSLATNGFFLLNLGSTITAEDFDDRSKVTQSFFPQLAGAVKSSLGASRIQIFDYALRKRHHDFPISNGGVYEHKQPSCVAHVDSTTGDMERLRRELNLAEYQSLSKLRCQFLTAWMPLRGPARDWPLTLCDVQSVDPKTDLEPCDLVDPNEISETYSVHYTPRQRWCYLKDQMPGEVWVFLQADSNGAIGVPHASFQHPEATEKDPLRESIEVRMLVFYED
ncbi:hypothetical protein TWF730_003714 [Orbilia blumenaviensis]|uniref:Methyltransferase n=1 Tax=Orbilia blumenaviensis TaxID=1796055 RepID=A0AAV9U363_9PEZI